MEELDGCFNKSADLVTRKDNTWSDTNLKMENIIKETTEKLSNGIITKDEADKILLDLFGATKLVCLHHSWWECVFKQNGICVSKKDCEYKYKTVL